MVNHWQNISTLAIIRNKYSLRTSQRREMQSLGFRTWLLSVGCGVAASASPGNLLEMQSLRPHPGPTASEPAVEQGPQGIHMYFILWGVPLWGWYCRLLTLTSPCHGPSSRLCFTVWLQSYKLFFAPISCFVPHCFVFCCTIMGSVGKGSFQKNH